VVDVVSAIAVFVVFVVCGLSSSSKALFCTVFVFLVMMFVC